MKKATKAFAAVLSVAMFAGVVMTTACTPVETQIDEYAVTLSYNDGISRPRIAYVEKESSLSTPRRTYPRRISDRQVDGRGNGRKRDNFPLYS